jgi:uncharacterized protein YuzE
MPNKKIEIKYLRAYDYRASVSTGVYGGITPTGLISANFYIDRIAVPDSEEIEVSEDGKVVGQPVVHTGAHLIREVQHGVLMDLNSARVIVNWLNGKIVELEKALSGGKK